MKELKIPSGWLEEEKGHKTSAPNSEQQGPDNCLLQSVKIPKVWSLKFPLHWGWQSISELKLNSSRLY